MRYATQILKRLALLTLPMLALAIPARAAAQAEGNPDDIMIVANKSVPAKELSIDDVRSMFLKRKLTWDGSYPIVPIHPSLDGALRKEFLKRVINLSSDDEYRYWENQKIRFGVSVPCSFSNNLKAVFMLKGGITYIRRKHYKEGVAKILLTLPHGEAPRR
ncbi:MAG: substrate-binding domain-containing protein [Myxococcota bacterium]|jgi:hypothetical protein|nr:substrate-binding domain-containing protein [Myxococcota bacterium]